MGRVRIGKGVSMRPRGVKGVKAKNAGSAGLPDQAFLNRGFAAP